MTLTKLLDYLPRGNLLDDATWRKRHLFLRWVLGLHLPGLLLFGLWIGETVPYVLAVLSVPALFLLIASVVQHRRVASFFVTAGLTWCSVTLVMFSKGSIEAHFHFFIIVGFIALYQDWVPFLWNIVFTTVSHGVGSAIQPDLIFNHIAGQNNPWLWSVIHGVSVLAACIGVVVFWRETEDEQQKTLALRTELAQTEITQRKFTSDLLVNLARRNQSMLYRQLDIIGQLEEKERDPDALAELFRLDHLATRIRRNAESLLVLSGEEPTRVWSDPVRLIDVVRAAIAETEDLDRVAFAVDERMKVLGHLVTDLTHVLAELTENAVRFSPPDANVTIRTRPYMRKPGAAVLTVEDWGVGMRPEDMAAANDMLAHPQDVDLAVSKRLGLHVVARLAARHHIQVSLTATPGCGVTAAIVLPPEVFAEGPRGGGHDAGPAPAGRGRPMDRAAPTGPRVVPVSEPPPAAAQAEIPIPRRAQSQPIPHRVRTGPPRPGTGSHPDRNGAGSNGAASNGAASNGAAGTPSAYGSAGNGTVAGGSMTDRPVTTGSEGNAPASNGSATRGAVTHETPAANGGPVRSAQRGMHATPPRTEQHAGDGENASEWTGWWTPVRLPTVEGESWEEEPVHASGQRTFQDAHEGWTPPTAALPAGPAQPSRPENPTGPVITARSPRPGPGEGTGQHHNHGRPVAGNGSNGHDDPHTGSRHPGAGGGSAPLDPRLSRRVPQASLAPELRREGEEDHEEAVIPQPAPPPDAEWTRDALSRFQASRQAAQQESGTETERGDDGDTAWRDDGWRRS